MLLLLLLLLLKTATTAVTATGALVKLPPHNGATAAFSCPPSSLCATVADWLAPPTQSYSPPGTQVAVICGRNKALLSRVRNTVWPGGSHVVACGFVDNIHEVWQQTWIVDNRNHNTTTTSSIMQHQSPLWSAWHGTCHCSSFTAYNHLPRPWR
jgi:hypothetical protein